MANYDNFMKTIAGFNLTSSDTPLDGRMVVKLDEDIKLVPFPYVGQVIYSHESKRFFIIKSLKDGWQDIKTGEFFDEDPQRPVEEVRMKKNSLVNEFEPINKVDKEEGKSLIADSEIERLLTLKNYDDAELRAAIEELVNSKVDKEEGKSLVDDAEIARLAQVDNYDDSELRELIDTKIADLVDGAPEALDTLKELGDALNAHEDAYNSLLEVVGNKADANHVHDQYLTEHQDISGKVDKVDGKSLISDAEIERLAQVDNYDDSELRAAVEAKVDKEEGKSLISDTEMARLALVDNYDDSELRGLIDGKADVNHVHEQYLTEHQDISGKVDKEEGKSLVDDAEIARLAQVDNYDDSELRGLIDTKIANLVDGAPEALDTLKELGDALNAHEGAYEALLEVVGNKADANHVHNQYLTEHQDISGKVDKVDGKSLVDDTEIARLALVDNYDDSELRGLIDGKADVNHVHEQYLTEHQDISGKVDKVEGKSLVDDTEIARLALVDNYNDSEVKGRINVLETINLETKPYIDKNGALILCGCPAVARPNTGKLLDPEANETDIVVSVRYYKKALDKFVFTADQFATLRIHMGYGDEGIGSKRNISETTLELYDIDRVGVIFGGSQITGEIGTVNIIVERCNTISSLLCAYCTEGGAKNVTHNFNLKVKDCGSVSSIFGGTNGYGVVWNSHVEVENTNVGYLVAGGSNGFTRKSEVVLNGGNVAVMQGVNRGILEEAKLIVNGGNVEKFYAAGDTEDNTVTGIQYKAIVELNGGTIQNFFNGNSNSLPFDSSNIEGTISPDCTVLNGDTSMLEVKQPEPNEIEELRVALDTKVDKVDGKSLVDDAEIARLALVDNYDDSELRGLIDTKIANLVDGAPEALDTLKELGDALNAHEGAYEALLEVVGKKADADHVHDQYLTEHQDISGKVDKEEGKSLISDAEIERLALVDNYDDSELRGLIDGKADVNHVHDQYLTEHQDISGKVDKVEGKSLVDDAEIARLASVHNYDDAELKTLIYAKADKEHSHEQYITVQNLDTKVDKVDGKSLVADSEIARLAQVDNYDDSELRGLIDGKADVNHVHDQYLTEHQDISGKVDKEEGKSLISDLEIERLASVHNYDDSELRGLIDGKADVNHIHDQYLTEHQDISGKVDKVEGKSLVDDVEIERLAQVYNYNDSEVKERINVLETINLETKPYIDKNGALILCGCPAVARPNTGKLLDPEANETDIVVSVRYYKKALDKFVFTADQFSTLRIHMGYGDEGIGSKRNISETTLELYDIDRAGVIFGGSKITGEIGTVNIIVERCNAISSILCAYCTEGGAKNVTHNFNLKVKDCRSVSSIFGGTNGYGVVWNSHVEVENTNVGYLVAGGSNGFTRKSEVILNGGNIEVMQGVNRGILEEARLVVNSGNVINFYAAGDTEDSTVTGIQYKAIVELNGGTIENFFNGNSDSLPFDSSNIEGTISPNCTVLNGDISMLVEKQPEPNEVEELRVALEAKVDKVEGKSLISDVEMARLALVDNYDDSELRGLINGKANADHVHNQYLTEHQDISGKVDKEEGKSLISDVEMARLALVDNYDDSELRGLIDGKANADHVHNQYLTEHQDISGKVDKVDGKSLVDDAEIARLAQVDNYDDSELRGLIDTKIAGLVDGAPEALDTLKELGDALSAHEDAYNALLEVVGKKANADHVHNQYLTEHQDISGKVDKEEGKSLISDAEMARLASVDNYNDTEVKERINVLETINLETKPYIDKNGALILCGCPAVARPNTGKLLDPEADETDVIVSVRYYKKALDKFVFTADQFATLRIHMGYGDEGIGSKRNISETTLELYDLDRVGVIFGGSKITGEIGTVNIIVERCKTISSLLCAYCTEGGAKNVTHNFNLKVKDCGSVSSIFGGTNGYGVVWNSHVEVENTNVGYLVAGGSNGFTRKSEVVLNGGNIEVMQGVNRGILEEARLVVNSGKVVNFYAAGDTEDNTVTGTQYKAIVELNGGTIENFSNGNSNLLPFDSSNIEGTISADCTVVNGDTSMLEVKQPEPNEIEELRVALETKVDKEEGKSLVDDAEIARLAQVNNYDDSELRGLIDGKANADHVHNQYLTEHQDISGKVDKVEGKSLISDTEIERLASVDNYNDSELRGLIDGKANTDHVHEQYLTEHQDISGKVDKEEGKSLVANSEIARLALVDNYNDSELKGLVNGKADVNHVHNQYLTEHQDISGKVDKVDGKSLISDAEIERLALVNNYDDTNVKERINVLETINLETKPYIDKNGMLVLCGCPAVARPNTGKLLDSEANETDVVVSVRFYQDALDKFVFTADQFAKLRICMGYGAEGVGTKRNIVETTLELYDLDRVYIIDGGSQITGEIGTVNIIAERCNYIDGIQGARGMNGGERNIVHNFNVKVKDCGLIDSIFGGANGYAVVWNSHVEVENTNVNYLIAGGSNGFVRKSEVVLNGGNINVMQGVNRGILEEAKLIVNSGNVTNFYAAGDTQDNTVTGTQYKAIVELNGGTIQNFFNGNSNSLPFNSSNIEGTISPDCTVSNGDTSMLDVKQPEPQAPSFAFNENGELVVTINGVSKTFVPKSE